MAVRLPAPEAVSFSCRPDDQEHPTPMTEPRTDTPAAPAYRPQSPWVSAVGYFIFFSRWLQPPLYLGLIVAQIIYVIVFMMELWSLGEHVVGSFLFPGDSPFQFSVATVMLAV